MRKIIRDWPNAVCAFERFIFQGGRQPVNYFHGMCELPQQQDIQDAAGRIPGAGFQ